MFQLQPVILAGNMDALPFCAAGFTRSAADSIGTLLNEQGLVSGNEVAGAQLVGKVVLELRRLQLH
jgi:hypothetical protein